MKNSEFLAQSFYAETLRILKESDFTFMVAGGFAVRAYTGLGAEPAGAVPEAEPVMAPTPATAG